MEAQDRDVVALPSGVAEWVDATRDATGASSRAAAHHVLLAVLDAIGEVLTEDEAGVIARELPGPLASILASAARRDVHADGDLALQELVHGVEWRENVPPGFAREHASGVCRVLAERLSPSARAKLRANLPASLAALFTSSARPAPPRRPAHEVHPPPRDTLAEGRDGSKHPLSEARPTTAHAHSVARNPDPHGETKLSSAAGLTQERLGDALATATASPGPARRVGETH